VRTKTSIESLRSQTIEQILEPRDVFSEDERIAKIIGHVQQAKVDDVFLFGEKRRVSGATVRDLISASDPVNMKLGNIVHPFPEIGKNGTFAEAARLLYEYRLHAIPLAPTEDGKLSVVSDRSIIKKMDDSLEILTKVSDVMTPSPVTIDSGDTVLKAKSLMIRRGFDHLPVMKDGKLHAMLTSSDILRDLLPEERVPSRGNPETRFDYPVEKIATEPVIEAEPSATVSNVISLLLKKRSSYVVVSLWDEVQGIITLRDVMRPLLPQREDNSLFYIVGLPADPFEAESAKMKLDRIGRKLAKAIPSIREIRAVVKHSDIGPGRRRYEVSFDVYLTGGMHSFAEEGYDLAEIFDRVDPRLQRIISSKQSRVTRTAGESLRKHNPLESD
jgi:CBS domain-containing protein